MPEIVLGAGDAGMGKKVADPVLVKVSFQWNQ